MLTVFTLIAIALALSGVILGSVSLSEVRDIAESQSKAAAQSAPTPVPINTAPNTTESSETLDEIVARGFLRCGIPVGLGGFAVEDADGVQVGFDADLCRAIAAAVFGTAEERLEFIPIENFGDRWTFLQNKSVDVLASVATITMERDVHEPSVGVGFEFTTPYLYNGVGFGGRQPYLDCVEQGNFTGTCSSALICVNQGTTHVEIVRQVAPKLDLFPVESTTALYENFMDGTCNVIAEEQTGISPSILKIMGYTGDDYEVGLAQYSKEPLAVVTREGDAFWSDFVYWVVESLMSAEERGIVQANASAFPETPYFGDAYLRMFQNAVAQVGSYSEMYERHIESIVPRSILNTINNGTSGLMYSFPFGSLLTVGKGPVAGGTLEAIRKRGHLKCGIGTTGRFGDFDRPSRSWSGFDVDYCRALSAAIFDGVDTHVVYSVLPASVRFNALASGLVDCLSRTTTVTQERDRAEPTTGGGLSFAPVAFYDGLSFAGIPPFGACADKLDWTSTECQDLKICVQDGTTSITIVRELFPAEIIIPQISGPDSFAALGFDCNAIGGDGADISAGSLFIFGYSGDYELGTRRFSKEPLAIVTREDDHQWSNFVRWIVHATIFAEEEGITQANATEMPKSDLFGTALRNMFIDAVNAVGSYGEIYARNTELLMARDGGINALNRNPAGPQQYPGVF